MRLWRLPCARFVINPDSTEPQFLQKLTPFIHHVRIVEDSQRQESYYLTVATLSSDDYYKQSAIFLLGLYHLHVYIQVSFSLFFSISLCRCMVQKVFGQGLMKHCRSQGVHILYLVISAILHSIDMINNVNRNEWCPIWSKREWLLMPMIILFFPLRPWVYERISL